MPPDTGSCEVPTMGYILLGRVADEVTLVSHTLFETRQAALAELSRVSAVPGSSVPDEVFVVDIESAMPVLIVPQAGPAAVDHPEEAEPAPASSGEVAESIDEAVESPSDASVWEAPAEEAPAEVEEVPAPVEDTIAEAIVADAEGDLPEPVSPEDATLHVAEESATPLHDALKRAAGALESSGIVAPDPVAPSGTPEDTEHPAASWPWDTSEPADPSSPVPEEAEPTTEDFEGSSEFASERVLESELDEPPAAYVPDPLEEPALDDSPLIHTAPEGSEEYEVRAVMMGTYDEPPPAVSEPASVDPPVDDEESSADEDDPEISGLLADLEEIPAPPSVGAGVGDAEADPDRGPDAGADEPGAQGDMPEVDDSPEAGAYEGGDSDISELSCDECVYVNTCPKRGESDPSSCGSFQWRAI